MEHTRDEALNAIGERATRQQATAAAMVEQAQIGVEESNRLEEERQAAYRYFQATGKDILDLDTHDVAEDEPTPYEETTNSLQDRMSALGTLLVDEPEPAWTRGGTTVLRWGIMQDDDSEDFTLGVSVAYNDGEPADLYLAVTQQRLQEWRSLQGADGEQRLTQKLVLNLLQIAGEDIAIEIVSALKELVAGAGSLVHQDPPTETAVGTADDEADYDDDALTTEDDS